MGSEGSGGIGGDHAGIVNVGTPGKVGRDGNVGGIGSAGSGGIGGLHAGMDRDGTPGSTGNPGNTGGIGNGSGGIRGIGGLQGSIDRGGKAQLLMGSGITLSRVARMDRREAVLPAMDYQ